MGEPPEAHTTPLLARGEETPCSENLICREAQERAGEGGDRGSKGG